MSLYTHMDGDHGRFKKIVRGWVRRELGKFIASGDLVTSLGGDRRSGSRPRKITIPLPSIELPQFSLAPPGSRGGGMGVGQGSGQSGDSVPGSPGQPGMEGGPGEGPGEHVLEEGLSPEELADILGEELGLPRIEEKGTGELTYERKKYSSVSPQGVDSLKHFKKTYKSALKRSLATGIYNPRDPVIIPHRGDQHYRTAQPIPEPAHQAVMIYMMDVSGSMGEEQKEIVRLTSFWLDTWIKKHYRGLERRYIIHDATAREVSDEEFYRTKESGGTLISSAYKTAVELIQKEYAPEEWNIYLFHFSDGDNWSTQDSNQCLDMLEHKLLDQVNLFCYGQTHSRYGSGQFLGELESRFGKNHEKVILKAIKNRDGIVQALKAFLGTGR